MLSVNLEMIVLSSDLRDCHHIVLLLISYKKETLFGEGVDLFPAGHHWQQAAALPVYVSSSY